MPICSASAMSSSYIFSGIAPMYSFLISFSVSIEGLKNKFLACPAFMTTEARLVVGAFCVLTREQIARGVPYNWLLYDSSIFLCVGKVKCILVIDFTIHSRMFL